MISLIGIITFLLRLTLFFQSQAIAFFPGDFISNKECEALEADNFQLHSIFEEDGNNSLALCESEEEEKSESETETLAKKVDFINESGFAQNSKTFYNPFFGNKALQGNQHLYDLFHSWKTHLS